MSAKATGASSTNPAAVIGRPWASFIGGWTPLVRMPDTGVGCCESCPFRILAAAFSRPTNAASATRSRQKTTVVARVEERGRGVTAQGMGLSFPADLRRNDTRGGLHGQLSSPLVEAVRR